MKTICAVFKKRPSFLETTKQLLLRGPFERWGLIRCISLVRLMSPSAPDWSIIKVRASAAHETAWLERDVCKEEGDCQIRQAASAKHPLLKTSAPLAR